MIPASYPYVVPVRSGRLSHKFQIANPEIETRFGANHTFAVFSRDQAYRYLLAWDFGASLFTDNGLIVWLMLNPSSATETRLDPTLTRCADFTQSWGYTAMLITNLFAEVETDSHLLGKHGRDPVGPENDGFLRQLPRNVTIVAGWGAHPAARERARAVQKILGPLRLSCLGTNSDFSPVHPLYQPASRRPIPWSPA